MAVCVARVGEGRPGGDETEIKWVRLCGCCVFDSNWVLCRIDFGVMEMSNVCLGEFKWKNVRG